MNSPYPHWPPYPAHPSIDLLGFGTTLGQILAHHTQGVEAHRQAIEVQQDILSALHSLPVRLATELEHHARRRSLLARARSAWPWLTGLGYLIAVVSGKLGAGEALLKFLSM